MSTLYKLCLPVAQIGAAAHEYLERGEGGTVLAVLSGADYLRTSSQEILWIASPGVPMHRRSLKLGTALPQLEAGARFCVEGCSLKIEPGVILNLAAAELWQPHCLTPEEAISMAEVPGRTRALAARLDLTRARGLGHLIPWLVGDRWEAAGKDDPVLSHAWPAIQGLFKALRRGDEVRAVGCAGALVGLGAGLTPSGDDFLGGLLFAASLLRAAYPGSRIVDGTAAVESGRARTHPISFALLRDHGDGHAIAPLHSIADGLLTGASTESICPAVLQLVQVGHSTGWDMLAGLFAGLLAVGCGGGRSAQVGMEEFPPLSGRPAAPGLEGTAPPAP